MGEVIISKESEPPKDFISEVRGILKGSGLSSEKYINISSLKEKIRRLKDEKVFYGLAAILRKSIPDF